VSALRKDATGKTTPMYNTWRSMLRRCESPKATGFKEYGGRGITVCERWHSFDDFFADMAPRPEGMTLDRSETNGNYEPGNCKWSTPTEQARNRRNNRLFILDGVTKTLQQISEESGIGVMTLIGRLKHNPDIKKSLLSPVAQAKVEYQGRMRSLKEISELCGVKACTLWTRLNSGWAIDTATTVMPNRMNRGIR